MREQTLRPEGQVALVVAALALGCTRTPPAPAEAGVLDAGPPPDAAVDAALEAAAAATLDKGPFNVLLVTVDSLRADMPWAGYERPIAPRLSALYKQSVAWTRAYSTSSFTSKSIPGFLTGKYPSELQRTGQFFTRYLDPKEFLCKNLSAEGISCVGAHAHMYFNPPGSGFEHGFSTWKIVPNLQFDYTTDPYITSDKLTPIAIDLMTEAAKDDKPFVAWFHYMDVHDKYFSHAESPHFGTKSRDLYDEEVFWTDMWIGKLLDFVESQPWGKKTAIIVSADHGEGFGEHNVWRHAHEVWEELVRVPLFAKVPGREPRTIDVPRSGIDIPATIAELVGMKDVPPMHGKSLLPEIDGATPEERDVVVDLPEDDHNERRRALIHGKYKLIAFGDDYRFSLFDLESDPGEKKDLWRESPDLAKEIRERYREVSKQIVYVHPRGGIPGKPEKDPKKR
ncbi:MAG: sulfatase [Labilithrix sp.]|nr:sulfatase [Labilithrix sp.]MCW5816412.1 sulfatase [Labilithrix sp.]